MVHLKTKRNNQISLHKNINKLVPDSKYVVVSLYDLDKKHFEKSKSHNVKVQSYQEKFRLAAEKGHIFTMNGGYSMLRQILLKRGWIEKYTSDFIPKIQALPDETIMGLIRPGNIYEKIAISNLAKNYTPKFIWQHRYNNKNCLKSYQNCINRSENMNFTTKHGISNCIENAYWYTEKGLSEVLAPRCYCISNPETYVEFLRDYRTTYCCSLLKIIVSRNPLDIFSENGEIPFKTVEFAMKRIRKEIYVRTSTDINISIKNNSFGDEFDNELDWSKFYSSVDLINKQEYKITISNVLEPNLIRNMCNELIEQFKKFWPLLSSEGNNNLWILKPGFSSRGRGIYIKNKIHDIINYVNRRPLKRYVLQKYLEDPLLIYKTKFDIRQHILLTIMQNKFNIWVYKDCYLRFCSQEYQLNDLAEAIHLTNHCVQQKYQNGTRDVNLPKNNMWSLKDFKSYLKTIKKSNMWDYKIYPGIKKNIIGVIMASLNDTEFVENKFDLYGCDFMINKFYETILIEINSSPDMSGTTTVSKKVCPAVLNDLIKVVVDYPDNKNTDIGKFDLIYSVDLGKWSQRCGNNKQLNISVVGKTINIPKPCNIINKFPGPVQNTITTITPNYNPNLPGYLKNYRKITFD